MQASERVIWQELPWDVAGGCWDIDGGKCLTDINASELMRISPAQIRALHSALAVYIDTRYSSLPERLRIVPSMRREKSLSTSCSCGLRTTTVSSTMVVALASVSRNASSPWLVR
jgi:hypothetical protein